MADLLKRLEGRGGSGRMAFLAHRDEIAQALAKGYTVKAVWQALKDEGVMPVGYEAFLRYARELPEYGTRGKARQAADGNAPAREPERVRPRPAGEFSLRPESFKDNMRRKT